MTFFVKVVFAETVLLKNGMDFVKNVITRAQRKFRVAFYLQILKGPLRSPEREINSNEVEYCKIKAKMSAKLNKVLAALQKEMDNLKVEIKNEEKKAMKVSTKRPINIEDCTCIEQLKNHFTVNELKVWLKQNKINVKKIKEKHKEDFVKIVWENISDEYESDYSNDTESDSEEEWEYYYE
jgi:hypothetical protein